MSWDVNPLSYLPPTRGRSKEGVIVGMVVSFLYFQTALAPEAFFPLPQPITLVAVGDVLLSRHVGTKIDQTQNPDLPFAGLRDMLTQADITFGNLECPLSRNPHPLREGLVFRCLTKYVPGLLNAGFDVLSTANNHAFDQGIDDLEFTVEYLQNQNILPVGTGDDQEPSVMLERHGTKFGFLAYSYTARNDGGRSTHPQIATMEIQKLESDISRLKALGADVIVVSMHAGIEYTRKPNQQQIEFARAAIDAGANAVIGHHPHWIQEVEIYPPSSPPASPEAKIGGEKEGVKSGVIFYSLGNFVFDQMWSENTREGLMVELKFQDAKLQQAKLIPIIIDNYCCPRLTGKEEKQRILKKINLASDTITF